MTRAPATAGYLANLGAEVVEGDLTRPETLTEACRGVHAVIAAAHAALGRGSNCPLTVDGQGHRDLISAASSAGVRLFAYAGAAGGGPDHPVDFFRIKSEIEDLLRSSSLSHVIVQGPSFMETQHEILGSTIRDKGQAFLFGKGEGRTTFVSVEDMARYLVWGLEDPRLLNRTVLVGGPDNLSQNEMVAVYEKVLGVSVKRRYLPVPVLRVLKAVVGPFHSVARRILTMGALMATSDSSFDARPLHAEFDWRPRSYEESVRAWAEGA
jgi:NADH dehydrogenase